MSVTSVDQMKRLSDDLGGIGPEVDSRLTVFPSGAAMLDVRRNGRAVVMAYSPTQGFGVDMLRPDEGLGNHYRFTSTDFESAARQLRALAAPDAPALSLLVIQVKDIESAREFYSLLGLHFVAEHHGTGPRHYAATLGPLVFEIYPCRNGGMAAPMRLGFRVPFLDETLELLRSRGVRMISEPKESPWGRRAVVQDVDGNHVELTASA
ncbi:MAG: VOC family protein [Gemmataceae bacterium]|nr:VOC family protein [Gemmataceae bacterium]